MFCRLSEKARARRRKAQKEQFELITLDEFEVMGETPSAEEEFSPPSNRVHDILDFGDEDPLSRLLNAENVRLVAKGLSRLNDHERLCLILSFYDNLPIERIADILRISVMQASQLRRRGLKHLGGYLRRYQ